MKYLPAFLLVALFALSGFTWGETQDQKKTAKTTARTNTSSYQAQQPMKKETARSKEMVQSGTSYSNTAYVPAPTSDNRASAVRVLTAGDEATRKARLESLSRLAKSLAEAKQAQQKTNANNYQY